MTAPLYQVVNWNGNFESAKSRMIQRCANTYAPNKHGGSGWSNVMAEEDGAAIWGIWKMLLDICSRQDRPREGWLTADGKKNGRRLSARELSNQLRRPIGEIHRALQILQSPEVAFIQLVEGQPEHLQGIPAGYLKSTPIAVEPPAPQEHSESSAVSTEYPPGGLGRGTQRQIEEQTDISLSKAGGKDEHQPDTASAAEQHHEDTSGTPAEHSAATTQSPDDLIQHVEAKALIGALVGKVFDRRVREADWHNSQKDYWLDQVLPIRRSDWKALEWFYLLPADHEGLKKTARVQSFEALLENFGRETDKAKSLRKTLGLNGQFGGEETRAVDTGWTTERVAAFEKHFGEERERPARFADLGASACRKLDEMGAIE